MAGQSSDVQSQDEPIGQTDAAEELISLAQQLAEGDAGNAQDEDELYTHYAIRTRYMPDDHILGGPIAAKPGSQTVGQELIRVAIPTCNISVEWVCWRKGTKPDLPHPYTPNVQDKNVVFARSEGPEFDMVDIEGDSKLMFYASGTYYYYHRDRYAMTLSYPDNPYIDLPDKSILAVQDSNWVRGLIEAPPWPSFPSTVMTRNIQ